MANIFNSDENVHAGFAGSTMQERRRAEMAIKYYGSGAFIVNKQEGEK